MAKPNGNLIIGNEVFNINAPVINWRDSGWDATLPYCIPTRNDSGATCRPAASGQEPWAVPPQPPDKPYLRRYAYRPGMQLEGDHPTYKSTKAAVKQFVIHHDGCTSADMCFGVLQNERGLSVHFLLDNDGYIYQTIDLGLMAYHAADWNLHSIGIELCSRGDAIKYPDTYKAGRFGPVRESLPCKINNNTLRAFDYTKAQYESFAMLCRELLRLLPNLPADYPQSSPGEQMWNTLANANVERDRYAGYIGHYHITDQKWDPGPFDFKKFCTALRGSLCFPVFPKLEPKPGEDKPVVPDDPGELHAAAAALYDLNEGRADGGFFPVGPWGETRMWHGGIHVIGRPGAGVFAPYPGRLVAARMGRNSPIGSFNFVLLRHDLTLGDKKLQFYSLYMHLADELQRDSPVDWMTKDRWKRRAGNADAVALLDEPIEAGALIGHIGKVGPDDLSRAQVHVEFFSEQLIEDPQWQLVDGTSGGRFCESAEINALIDQNHDGVLSRQELSEFFQRGTGELHKMVTLHISEWTFDPPWSEAVIVAADYKRRPRREIQQMVDEQITPGLWWDAAVTKHCRLPPDGLVHHYHPVQFISWFKTKLIDAGIAAEKDVTRKFKESDVREVPASITDDYHDKSGTSMRSTADVAEDPCNKNLTLEQMVQGFDAPECTTK